MVWLRRISREDQVEEMVRLLACIHDEEPRMTVADEMVWASRPQFGYIVHDGYKWWSRACQEVPGMAARTEQIWSWKIPCNIKIFMWLALQGRLLTKVHRAKWRPEASVMCELCNAECETVEHLFLLCPMGVQLWEALSNLVGLQLRCASLNELWKVMSKTRARGDSKAQAGMESLLIPVGMWAIWTTRNSLIFSNQKFYFENLWESMIHLIQDWGKHLVGLKTVNYTRGTLCIEEQKGPDGE
ncbi:hypothetical protein QJS04_geneDACA010842 [Acorus gramineus]|uniref:Reverse transcriptase zinc-binding domain-containing protein n=1 Tax=Acorus gramineus TaxID=55184 RepID=A0AAV9B7R1_ACOGR|nr:hypothetical protein QJS04_geneDACA010842 [Acorus gramineus]